MFALAKRKTLIDSLQPSSPTRSTPDGTHTLTTLLAVVQRQGLLASTEITRWLKGRSAPRVNPQPDTKTVTSGGSVRQQQLGELLTDIEKAERDKRLREADRNIVIAVATLGFSAAGTLYWPLKLLSLPGFLYLFMRNLNRTWRLIKQRRVGVPMIGTVVNLGTLACGYFTFGSIGLLVQQLADKMVATVVDDSRSKLINIFRMTPKKVWLIVEGSEVEVPFDSITVGQIVVVHAGEIIPVDGIVTAGVATVDQQFLTGEARPVDKQVGEQVFAATMVVAGQIHITIEKAGNETTVAQIGQILNHTLEYKSAIQLRADQLADRTVIPTFAAGAVALLFVGPMAALTLMGSHFRRTMGLFGPLSMMSYLNASSQRGVLIKDGRSFDLLSEIDTLVFDKTGTLTAEEPTVTAVHLCLGSHLTGEGMTTLTENEVLRLAAAAEQKQSHPIARAIRTAAETRALTVPLIEEAAYQIGYGLTVQIEGQIVRVGSGRLMTAAGMAIPAAMVEIEAEVYRRGHSLVLVAYNEQVIGGIELMPTVRPEVKTVIQTLRQQHNIRATYIISGDHTAPTRQLAEELGIDHYFAETLPEQKAEIVERLTQEGRFVCYVGDGINDAIALKKAHVSISLRGASSVAVDTAQIILVNSNLQALPDLFTFAHEFRRNTNTTFATVLGFSGLGMVGALFWHFTLIHASVLGMATLIAGLTTSLRPMVKYQLTAADDLVGRSRHG